MKMFDDFFATILYWLLLLVLGAVIANQIIGCLTASI